MPRKVIFLVIMLLLLQITVAQDDIIQITPEIILIRNLAWSNDGEILVFQDSCCAESGVTLSEANWYFYDINTQTLTRTNEWALAPALTEWEKDVAKLSPDKYNFMSPDESFMLYAGDSTDNTSLAILNREHNDFAILPFTKLNAFQGTDFFNVLWSDDGTSLVTRVTEVSPYQPIYGYLYINNYEQIVENTVIYEIYDETIDGDRHLLSNIHDISPDGALVLLKIFNTTGKGSNIGFYDPLSPQDTFIIPRNITKAETIDTAQFLEGDNNRIIYLNETGIYIYDRATGVADLIRDDIKSKEWNWMLFAPGGKHLALLRDDLVYILDLTDDLPQ